MSIADRSNSPSPLLIVFFMVIVPLGLAIAVFGAEAWDELHPKPEWCVEWQRELGGRTRKNKASFGTIERSIAFADKLDRLEGSVRIEVKPCD